MIEVENLSKYYSGFKAIDQVSFSIGSGEIAGLLGLNGAGKSTVLKILGCFLLPSGGRAKVDGHSVHDDPHSVRKIIGYLPDTPPLYNEMTVRGYLAYVAQLKDVPSSKVSSSVDAAMEKTSTQGVAESRLGELSHGFRQRVAIAQALVHDPKVLILDEPMNGLDPIQIVEMRDLILRLKTHHTVILSSHILSEITKTCDRILIIDNGHLVAEGNEADLEAKMAQNMRLTCEVDATPQQLVSDLKGLDGVTDVSVVEGGMGHLEIVVDTTQDLRKLVSRKVVESGTGLLGLRRDQAGLESLFMKLVQKH